MTEKTKKILTIVAFVFIVFIAAFLIYVLFFKSVVDNNTNIPNNNSSSNNNSGGKLTPSDNNTGTNVNIDDNENNNGNIDNGGSGINLTPEQIRDIINKNNGQDLDNLNNNNNNSTDKNTSLPEKEGTVANGGIVYTNTVVNNPTLGMVISGNSLITFNKNDGGFYKTDPNTGKNVLITQDKFKGAENIVWAPTSEKAIIEFPDGSNVMYDFNKNKQYILPKNWYDFSFQKDAEKIAFLIDSNNYKERWLSVANPDGSDMSPIEPLGNNADRVIVSYSPNEQMIALSRTGEAIGGLSQQVLLLGLHDENFKALDVQGRGFHPIWSPSGDKIVYDAYNTDTSYNPNLWVVNSKSDTLGTGHKSLGVSTWVSKCGFDSTGKNLYCGVPRSFIVGSGMFPETLKEAGIYDDIYKINVYSGYSQLIAKPIPDISVESLTVSSDNSVLYYKDAISGNIYNMKLK